MLTSYKKNKIGILLMIVSAICACIGQLLWKLSVNGNIFTLFLGFIFYGIGALIMIMAYRFGSLSVLQPMLSLSYILSTILGYFFLDESITYTKLLGIFVIIIGVTLIGGGDD